MSVLLVFLSVALLLAVYLLPYVVALVRRTRHRDLILLLDVLLGWTIYGWFFALVIAVFDTREDSMRQFTANSHDDPLKARISVTSTIEDDDKPQRVKDFVEAVLTTIPRIMHLYLEGDLSVRQRISDWFMSLDVDALRDDGEENHDDVVTMRRVGSLGRKLICNGCDQELNPKLSREVFDGVRKRCPHCEVKIVGVV